ncbi:PfkB family carbohydrate kinase, partial [Vibrio rotiferianus]
EPDGERTFLSASGVENNWNQETLNQLSINDDAIIYLSGYQLASACGAEIVNWLETLPSTVQLFIDFGPRIADIDATLLERLLAIKPIISLNRQEAEHLGMQDSPSFVEQWYSRYGCPLVLRIDSDGALFNNGESNGMVAPFAAEVVDTIGAGDTHAGGVLAGLSSGWELADAVLLGNAVASYVVSHEGGDCAPSVAQASLPYTITIVTLSLALLVAGRIQDQFGPKKVLMVGTLMAGIGMVLSSLSISPINLCLSFGVLTGTGIGFSYACLNPTAMKWFHASRKGMV